MLFDLRLAYSGLRRELLLSTLVICILGASLGVHTAVFALINGAFLRPLPFAEDDRLVVVESVSSKTGGTYGLSLPDADDYRAQSRLLEEVGSFTARRDNVLTEDGGVMSVRSALVTAGVLPAVGARAALGRMIEPADDQPGGDSYRVVLGDGFWRSHFGADPDVLGRTLRTSLGTYQIVGVLPPGFGFPERAQLWFPYQNWIDSQDSGDQREDQRAMRWPRGIALLADGVTLEQAQAELDGLGNALAERHPDTNADWRPKLEPYRQFAVAGLAPHLRSLFVMTWVFIALAAVNLAGLQVARSAARAGTFSLQLALGARGFRIGRQQLFETLLLTVPGVFLGLALARALVSLLPVWVPTALPGWLEVRIGASEIGFAAAAALAVAAAGGLVPLVLGWRLDLRSLLAGRSGSVAGGSRLRTSLVIAEVALAAVLLVAAGLLARSFGALEEIDPGFAVDQVVSVELSPQHQGTYLEQTDSLAALYRRIRDRLLEEPGVAAVGGTTHLPYYDRDRRPVTLIARGGEGEEELEHQAPILTVDVTPGYFDTMGIPMREGRDFAWSDSREAGLVIILSRRAAEQLFPGQSALGKEARISHDSWARVVGIVGDVRYDPREEEFGAELYYPITQYKAWRQRLTVRLEGSPQTLIPQLRGALEEAAPEAGVVELRPLDSILDESIWQARLLGRLAPLFAAVALLLASLGVYGLLAHDLAQRRQEIGVRAALGASAPALARLILWRGVRLVLVGVAVGAGVAIVAAPVIAASLFGVETRDLASFAAAAIALIGAGGAACLAPAWRATRVAPTESLRQG
ncbi:MAG: ADOP family duplicated permease [Acidobacteriota bacterium]